MLINIETKVVQTATNDPGYNWAGGDWAYVPPQFEADAWALAPYCDITVEDGVVTSITDNGTRPEPTELEPSPDIDTLAADVAEVQAAIDAFLQEVEEVGTDG